MMSRILALVSVYVILATTEVVLIARGLLRPMPWIPIFLMLMLAFGTVVLWPQRARVPMSDSVSSRFRWRDWFFLGWAIASFAGAFYGLLMFVSGRGDRGDLGGAMGATAWGLILVYVLRLKHKTNQSGSPGAPPAEQA